VAGAMALYVGEARAEMANEDSSVNADSSVNTNESCS